MTRERSFWAWGWADRFPDDGKRREIAEHVSMLLGLEGLVLEVPPTIESVEVTRARVEVPGKLARVASTEREARIRHTYGRAYRDVIRGFHGDFSAAPDVVALPENESDILDVMEWCQKEGLALVPYGGGTSVVGGVEARVNERRNGVVALDLSRLDRVVEVDEISRAARIQAGVMGPVLEAQLGATGHTLRHFPQSFEFSSLGGWIATRAGGHFATVYTHIDDLVESVRMLTPAGVLETRRLPASGAGPDPARLVIGSEGSLGIITEAWMRVQRRPGWRASASVLFDELMRGAEAARAIAQAGIFPSNCRLLDPTEALLNSVPTNGAAVLLLGYESADDERRAWIDRAVEIATRHGGRCETGVKVRVGSEGRDGRSAESSWRSAFLDAPYLQSVLASVGVLADTFETACTWDRFPALHAGVTAAVQQALRETCGGGVVTCRFTHVYPDGPAPYFTFLGRANKGGELEQWEVIKRAASDALLAHGGTITHHHAVGRTHRPWYDRERPDVFAAALKATKQTLDPHGILNPGVLLDMGEPIPLTADRGLRSEPMRVVLERRIAVGGLAEVHAARVVDPGPSIEPGSRVAVKRLHPRLAMDPQVVEAFDRERDLLMSLDHPNLVRALGAAEIKGESSHAFALELIEGPSLAALLTTLVRRGETSSPGTLSLPGDGEEREHEETPGGTAGERTSPRGSLSRKERGGGEGGRGFTRSDGRGANLTPQPPLPKGGGEGDPGITQGDGRNSPDCLPPLSFREREAGGVRFVPRSSPPGGISLSREDKETMRAANHGRANLRTSVMLRIVRDVLDALSCLHDAGYAHLDICPANAIVGVDGVTRLCDLGHARPLGTSVSFVSRPAYAAPELLERGEISAQVDVFSMGVVLWEALRRERLFASESDLTTMLRVASTCAPALDHGRDDLRGIPLLTELVARMLSPDPTMRSRSAREVIEVIDELEGAIVGSRDDVVYLVRGLSRRVPFQR